MKLGVVMDPISQINIAKDSTFAMLLAAQRKGWDLYYFEPTSLFATNEGVFANAASLTICDLKSDWFDLTAPKSTPLTDLDVILMRKDPPVDQNYLYATNLLAEAQRQGVLVVNHPKSLQTVNEKLFINCFPKCIPETLVSANYRQIQTFIKQHDDVILKPLDGMGGQAVFRSGPTDPNLNVILETLTDGEQKLIMAQRYLTEVKEGDKRILLIKGEPIPYALARLPKPGETRANLAKGGIAKGIHLTKRDYWICEQLKPVLNTMQLLFVGIDVIGDYLTEINITSPTCIRELDQIYNLDIGMKLIDAIETHQHH